MKKVKIEVEGLKKNPSSGDFVIVHRNGKTIPGMLVTCIGLACWDCLFYVKERGCHYTGCYDYEEQEQLAAISAEETLE